VPRKPRRTIRPINDMVLIRHDKAEAETSSGILLPDSARIEVLTGIVVAMPDKMKEDHLEYPFKEGDRVVYNTRERIPYNLDPRDPHYLVNYKFILGVVEEELPDEDEP